MLSFGAFLKDKKLASFRIFKSPNVGDIRAYPYFIHAETEPFLDLYFYLYFKAVMPEIIEHLNIRWAIQLTPMCCPLCFDNLLSSKISGNLHIAWQGFQQQDPEKIQIENFLFSVQQSQ